MKTTFKRALSVILALCVLVASATCLMGISVFAAEPDNVALLEADGENGWRNDHTSTKPRVLSSSENSFEGQDARAFNGTISDANGHKWIGNTSKEWIMIDLRGFYDISSATLHFHSGRVHKYNIYAVAYLNGVEYSEANKTNVYNAIKNDANKIVDRSANTVNPAVSDEFDSVKARYVMIDILSTTGNGQAVIEEIEIYGVPYEADDVVYTNDGAPETTNNIAYNYISSLTTEEKAQKVFASAEANPSKGYYAFDGVVANNGNVNQWYPGAAPAYLVVDLGEEYNLTAATVTFRTKATGDRKFTYALYGTKDLSVDYTSAKLDAIKTEMATPANQLTASQQVSCVATHTFNTHKAARYVLIDITAAGGDVNLFEFEIFGYSLASATATIDEANKTITVPSGLGLTVQDFVGGLTVSGNAYASIEKAPGALLEDGDLVLVDHEATAFTSTDDITTTLPGTTVYTIKTTNPNVAVLEETVWRGEADTTTPRVLSSSETFAGQDARAFNGTISDANGHKWVSATNGAAWIMIDLRDTYNLSGTTLHFHNGRVHKYNIYAVADLGNVEYSEANKTAVYNAIKNDANKIVDRSTNTENPKVSDTIGSVKARYVMVDVLSTTGNGQAVIEEMEIYGYQFSADEALVDEANNTITIPYSWGKNVTKAMLENDITATNALITVNQAGTYLANGDTLTATVLTSATTTKVITYDIIVPNSSSIAYLPEDTTTDRVIVSGEETNTWGYNAFDGKITNDNVNQWWVASDTGYIIIDLQDVYNLSNMDVYARYTASDVRTYTYDIYALTDLGDVVYSSDNKEAVHAAMKNGTKIVEAAENSASLSHEISNVQGRYVMVDITAGTGQINMAEIEIFGYALKSESGDAKFDYDNNTISVPFLWGDDISVDDVLADVSVLGNAYLTVAGDKLIVNYMSGETFEFTIVRGKSNGSQVNIFKPTAADKVTNFYNSEEQKVTVTAEAETQIFLSFEYYTATEKAYQPGISDSKVGMYLPAGRNKFTQTYIVTAEDGEVAPFIKSVVATAEPLYVWNVVIKIDNVDANVAYQAGEGVSYDKMETVASTLGINPSETFISRIDFTGVKDDDITANTRLGFLTSSAYLPGEDNVTASLNYYASGHASNIELWDTANGTSVGTRYQNVSGLDNNKVGVATKASIANGFTKSGNLAWYADVLIMANNIVYPDYFYVWDLTMETENHGSVTFIEHGGLSKGACLTGGVNVELPVTEIALGDDAGATISKDAVFTPGNVNGIDDDIDICDLVFLNANSQFKDIRTFDATYGDAFKSAADYTFVKEKIWAALGF